jgi:hypothetical protein
MLRVVPILMVLISLVAPVAAAERPPGTYTSEGTGIIVSPTAGFTLGKPYIRGTSVSIDATPIGGFPTNPGRRNMCTYTFVSNEPEIVRSVAEYERTLMADYQTQLIVERREEFTNPQGAHGIEIVMSPMLIDFLLLYNTAIETRRGRVELACGLLRSEGMAAVAKLRNLVDAISVP